MDEPRPETILKAGDLGPIEDHLTALATERRLPAYALGMCVARIEESGPPLRALLDRAAQGEWLEEADETLLFRGLYVLGAAQDPHGFASLLRLLARPGEDIEFLLGDLVTETLPRIVIGMFDGDVDRLFAAIADSSRNEYVRNALLGAATFLAWKGRIDRARMSDFLARFFDAPFAEQDDFAWCGWLDAVGQLNLRDLLDRAERVFSEHRIDHDIFDPESFEKLLVQAATAPDDQERFEENCLGHIEDVVEALRWTDSDEEPDTTSGAWRGFQAAFNDPPPVEPQDPILNPWRHVGRNDPCPCGSGKKFKKCCLSNGVTTLP